MQVRPHDPEALRLAFGYSLQSISTLFGISTRTWRDWTKKARFPNYVLKVFSFITGDLGALFPAWAGCHIRGEELFIDGWAKPVRLSEIKVIPLEREANYQRKLLIDQLRVENQNLRDAATRNKFSTAVVAKIEQSGDCLTVTIPRESIDACATSTCAPRDRRRLASSLF